MTDLEHDSNILQSVSGRPRAAKVLIAIPTYRRPGQLVRLLDAIAELETSADVRILVTDNEGEGGMGIAAIKALPPDFRFPIDTLAIPEKGLANVRNAIIRYARQIDGLEYIAMIDDDERPSPRWLDSLMEMQKRCDSDVVGGPTQPMFEASAPEWAPDCPLFWYGGFADGPIDMTWGTCNVLLHRRALDRLPGDLFDPVFNDWGGEDVDAFMRLKAAGSSFAWSNEAVVLDDIPASRTTMRWVTRRAFRIGNSNMIAQLRWRYGRGGKLKAFPFAVASWLAHSGLLLASLPSQRQRIRRFCDWMRSSGKLAYLMGFAFREYK